MLTSSSPSPSLLQRRSRKRRRSPFKVGRRNSVRLILCSSSAPHAVAFMLLLPMMILSTCQQVTTTTTQVDALLFLQPTTTAAGASTVASTKTTTPKKTSSSSSSSNTRLSFLSATATKLVDRIHRPKIIRPDENVIFFPTTSSFDSASNEWIVPIHGWIFDDDNDNDGRSGGETTKTRGRDDGKLHRSRALLGLGRRKGQLTTTALVVEQEDYADGGSKDNKHHFTQKSDDEEMNIMEETIFAAAFNTDGDDKKEQKKQKKEELKQLKKQQKKILQRRIRPFVVDNHRRRSITLQFHTGNQNPDSTSYIVELPERSRKNGHFHANLRFSNEQIQGMLTQQQPASDTNNKLTPHAANSTKEATATSNNKMISFHAVTGRKNDTRQFAGRSYLVHDTPNAFSVISDIDDTIKISHVLEKKKLLSHFFLHEFQPVPGMAELYSSWHRQHPDLTLHFVSSSPWQLYSELQDFLQRHRFPIDHVPNSFHLKSVRLKDRTLLSLLADPLSSKLAKITSILEMYPHRKFVLVGDTGEKDPEVYGEIYRQYPTQIHKIMLRDVTSALTPTQLDKLRERAIKKKRTFLLDQPELRYELAFRDVPDSVWSVFTEAPTDLEL